MSLINFFATRADLLDLLTEVESKQDIHYAEAGMFDNDGLVVYTSATRIPGLGESQVQQSVQGRILLIADVPTEFVLRSVPQRRGGVRYAVDQKQNPDSVSLLPGGQFDEQTILAGNFGTCTDSSASLALIKLITETTKGKWAKIKSYAVGPEAAKILDSGGRLTANLHSPRVYDLQR